MNSIDYYQTEIAPRGSDLYYATRKMSHESRSHLLALFALEKEITEVIDECSDQGVARLKLQWWLTQIEKMYAGDAEHPAAIAFYDVCQMTNISKELIKSVVLGQLYLLDNPQCESVDAQVTLCHNTYCVVSELQTRVLGFKDENTLEFAKALGVFHGLVNIIISLRKHILKERVYLAPEDLHAHDISVDALWNITHSPALQQVLLRTDQRAREYYQHAMRALPKVDRKLQRPACLRAKLQLKLLDEVEKDGFQVFAHRVEIPPLRKLFITW